MVSNFEKFLILYFFLMKAQDHPFVGSKFPWIQITSSGPSRLVTRSDGSYYHYLLLLLDDIFQVFQAKVYYSL